MQQRRRPFRPGSAILLAILVAIVFKSLVLDVAIIEGHSMSPSLEPGELVLVLRCAYGLRSPLGQGGRGRYLLRWASPKPGDIVAARNPRDGRGIVKRVAVSAPPVLGSVFLLGDNLPESIDSRDYGAVSVESIAGKVIFWF